jgi:hypothetical protein
VVARSDSTARSQRAAYRLPALLLDLAAGRDVPVTEIDARVVGLAREHRMSGLLWTWARTHIADGELKRMLAQHDLYVQAHLARVWKVLEESVARLSAAGIEVATIKGVTAEARWYGRRGERPSSDVDLLLSPHQLDRVGEALKLLEPDHPWVPYAAQLAAKGRIQAVTTHVNGLEVDLHLDLLKLGIRTRQSSDVWERTTRFPLPGGGSVRVLDDTSALLHLLVHLNKDRFQRLLGYADVARVIAAGRVDWERAVQLARGEGISSSTFRTLEVLLDELALPWPAGVERPRGPRARIWDVIWRPAVRLRGIEGRLRFRKRQAWIALLARGRAREAIAWWLQTLWPTASLVSARYADVPGPYLWKLFRGRIRTARSTREKLDARRGR